jgi:hypothetical protein
MEYNIHIISEEPFKHHTEIIKDICGIHIKFYIDNVCLFSFHPKNNNLYFKSIRDIYLINKILKTTDIESYMHCGLYCANLDNIDNIEKLKELINNHTLSDEEQLAFRYFLYEPVFKLNFVD